MWVPLVENNEYLNEGADYFIKKNITNIFSKNKNIDTLLLACTHYPLLKQKIQKYLPAGVQLISQGEIVAASLKDYLERHSEMEKRLTRNKMLEFYTTDSSEDFDNHAKSFFGQAISSKHLEL
jgi:glutamate racemase